MVNTGKYRKLVKDPVFFAEKTLGWKPFDYQAEILRDSSARVLGLCGRQVGKSTTAAIALIHFAFTKPNTTSIIVSATLRQSMEVFDKVVDFILNSPAVRTSVIHRSRTRIRFSNGSRIICLPCGRTGWSLRGLTVHFAIIDEASFVPSEVIESVVFPMLSTTKGKLWLLTTPWSRDHTVYRVFMKPTPDWSIYHLPSSRSPLITKEFLNEQRELVGLDRFSKEYEAIFIDDVKSFFPMTLLGLNMHRCEKKEDCKFCEEYQNPIPNHREYFAGFDPAGGKEDFSAIVVVEKVNGKISVKYANQKKERPGEEDSRFYTTRDVELFDIHRKLRFKSVFVDQTGAGRPLVEHLRELGLPVEGVTFTARVKEELTTNLRLFLENNEIELPHDLALLNSLNCIEFERTRIGGYSFSHPAGTYDDLGWALALACMGVKRGRREGAVFV